MNTIKIKKSLTQLVAHRGLSGIETENTNAAFVAAGNRSYYGIETDIQRTKDGVLAYDSRNHWISKKDVNSLCSYNTKKIPTDSICRKGRRDAFGFMAL